MTNNHISIRIIYRDAITTQCLTDDARKMFRYLLILSFIYQINCLNICDSGHCVCGFNNFENQDVLGESIKCSYSGLNISKVEYNLPDTVFSLDLSSNNISEVRTTKLFQSKTLVQLHLNRNNIKEINSQVLQLPELKRLDLSDNLLDYIDKETFRDIKKLEYLNLANNKFTTFTKLTFHHLSNLNEIILDNNNIGPDLRDSNLFDRSGFGLTTRIRNVSISGINLIAVPDNFFVDAYDLRKLIISNNNIVQIFEIPFTLEYLDVSDNPIKDISSEDFEDLPGLKVLILNNLEISEVPEYVFASLKSLTTLELERNINLTRFDSLAFGREVLDDADDFVLGRLSLKGSRLSALDGALLEPFGHLIELDLQGNPWACDCNIVWLKQLQISDHYNDHLRCATPSPLFNAKIFDLKAKYFVCENHNHHIGATIAVVTFAISLSAIAIAVFLCLPKYQSRCKVLKDMYNPSTAYSVLPMSTTFHNERD